MTTTTQIRSSYTSIAQLATETLLPLALRYEADQDKAVDVAVDAAMMISYQQDGRTYLHEEYRTEADLLNHIEWEIG